MVRFNGGSVRGSGGFTQIKKPTITNYAIPNKTFAEDLSFSITTPTSDSTGIFSYRSNNSSICTISGDTIFVTGAGTVFVTAIQRATTGFLPGYIDTSFIVVPITPTITNYYDLSNNFQINGSFTLTDPSSNSTGDFTYSSSDPTIATIVFNTVYYQQSGNVIITASQEANVGYTSKDVSFNFSIVSTKPTLSNFSISSNTFLLNAVVQLTPPTSNSNGTFSYTSGNTAVATVSGDTLIVKKTGSSVITATQSSYLGYSTADISNSFVVTSASPTISNYAVNGTNNVTYSPSGTIVISDPTTNSTGAVTYTSSNTAIVAVSGNTLIMNGAGKTNVRYTQSASGDYSAIIVDASFEVLKRTPTLSGFTNLSKSFGNAPFALTAPVSDSSGAFSYFSTNSRIASISGSTVTILSSGLVTITANQASNTNYNAATRTLTLTISQIAPTIDVLTLSNTSLIIGKSFVITTPPTSNSTASFRYSSSNNDIISVNGKVLKYLTAGNVTITATQNANDKYAEGSVSTTISLSTAATITNFVIPTVTYSVGGTATITDPSSNSVGAFTYSSNDTAIATVSDRTITVVSAGLVRIIGSQAASGFYGATQFANNFLVNKAAATITNFPSSDISYVFDLSFTLSNPTSTSPASFTFTSSNNSAATITGTNFKVVDVGNTIVTVSQLETTNFLAPTPVTATYSIKPVAPVIAYTVPSVSLIANGTFQLANPTVFKNETFTFSGNSAVATVTSSGLVTMLKAGSINVTATLTPTYKYLTNSVTVPVTINPILATITFSMGTATFVNNSTVAINTPTSNSTGGFLYNSSNNLIATVSGDILIMKGAGTTVITATQSASGDFLQTTKSTNFTITKGTPTLSYAIPDISFIYNSIVQIPSSQIQLPTSNSDGTFLYRSSNEPVAFSNTSGLVTFRKIGSTTIEVYQNESANYNSGFVSAVMNVVPGPSYVTPFAIPNAIFVLNGTVALPSTVTSPLSDGAITFASGNALIGTIIGNTLTMLKSGILKITANQAASADFGTASYTTSILITSGSPTITFSIPAQTFVLNSTYTLPAPTSNSTGTFTYASLTPSVATVSGNVVTMLTSGNVSIQATQSASGDFLTGSTTSVLTINKGTPSITNFAITDASFVFNGTLSINNPTTNSNGTFSYTSGNTSIATVTSGGLVTLKNTGNVTITASLSQGDNYVSGSATANILITTGVPTITPTPISTTFVKNGTFSIPALTSTSDGNVAYTSGNTSIATISGNVATLLHAGTLSLTAAQETSGNFVAGSATLFFTINKGTPSITNFNTISVPYVVDSSYAIIDPSSNSTGLFTYSSGNTSVATVTNNRFTPISVGSTTITVSQAFDNDFTVGSATATLTIVTGPPVITDFNVDTLVFSNGGTYTIIDPVSSSAGAFSYTSGDLSIATISGNTVTMVSAGDVVITVSQAASGFYTSGTATTTLSIKSFGTVLTNPTLSEFSILSQNFVANSVFTLSAPNSNSSGAFKYTSSNTSIATVKGNKVTILSGGAINIRATQLAFNTFASGTIDASLNIVNAVPVITFNNFIKPFVSSGTFVFDISSNSPGAITFTSGNPSVCTLSGYTATMVSAGSSLITAVQSANGSYAAKTVTATVNFRSSTAQILNRFSDLNRVGGNDISLNGNVLCSVFDKSNNSIYYGGSFNTLSYFSNGVAVYNTNADKLTYLDASNNAETNGTVYCSAYDSLNQLFYIGGSFTAVYDTSNGSITANNVAIWNCATNNWSVLGKDASNNGVGGTVYALAIDGNYNLHVGGRFSTVYKTAQSITTNTPNNYASTSVIPAANYSIWNNTTNGWINHTVGNSNTTVKALVYDSAINSMYVGANTTFTANSQTMSYIARLALSSSSWSSLGNSDNGVNGSVNTLFLDSLRNLYVGGAFSGYYNSSNSLTTSVGIAKYVQTTNQWSNINGNGLGSTSYSVNAITCDASNNVYVGGNIPSIYASSSLLACNNVAKFDVNSNTWNVLGSNANNGTNGNVLALQFNTSLRRLYVGGSFTAVYDSSLKVKPYYYAATWNTATSAWANLMEKTYTQLSSNVNTFLLDTYSSKLFVGGAFSSFSQSVNNVLRYDLSAAVMYPLGVDLMNGASGSVNAMALDTANNLYIGGSFANVYDSSAGTQTSNNIARWNITNRFWSVFGSGTSPSDNINTIVYESSFNAVYIGGVVTSVNGLPVNNVAKYSVASGSWSALGSSSYNGTDGAVNAMVFDNAKNLFIGGAFTTYSNSSATPDITNKIAKYTVATNQWSAVGSGLLNGNVKALSYDTSSNFLYAGGDFTSAYDVSGVKMCNNIAYWNVAISRWNTLGNTTSSSNGTSGVVNAILCDNSNQLVYVGGDFIKASSYNNGDVSANRAAIWNNSTNVWNVIGSTVNGFNAAVNTISLDASKNIALFGGNFIFASDASFNNNPASKIAYAYYNTNGYVLPLTISSFTLPAFQFNSNFGLNYSHSYTFESTTITGNSIVNLITNGYDLAGSNDAGSITTAAGFIAGPTISFAPINVTYNPSGVTIVPPTSTSTGAFSYSSSNTSVVTMSGDLIVFKGLGYSTITAVQANDGTYSAASITALLTTSVLTPTLTNFSISTKTLGDADFSLNLPTTNSTGAFTFASSDPTIALVTGRNVSIVAVGNAIITATQDASGFYNSNSTTASFAVNYPAPTFGTFTVPSKVFKTAPFTIADPSSNSSGLFTYTSSNTAVATVAGPTVTIVGVGNTTITANQEASGNFYIGSTTATLTVTVATPTFNAWTIATQPPANSTVNLLSYLPTSDSSGAITFTSGNATVASISGNTITTNNIGSVVITATQAAIGNFTSGSTTTTLTVVFATTTIASWSLPTFALYGVYTLPNPASNSNVPFTFSSSDPTVASLSGSTLTIVQAGSFTLTASQDASLNFSAGSISQGTSVSLGLLNSSYTMGSGGSGLSISPSDISFGTADYSIEFWHNPRNYRPIIGTSGSPTTGLTVTQIDISNIRLECYGGNTITYNMPVSMSLGYWHNVIFTRQFQGGVSTHACFVNGSKHTSFTVSNSATLPLTYNGFTNRIGSSAGY